MDRVTQSLMKTFAEKNELTTVKERELFEAFSTYCVVSKIMDNDFNYSDIDEMQVANSNDGGIDAVGLLINGEFVESLQSLNDILKRESIQLDVLIIFVQATTSSKFEGSKMDTFGRGIVDILRKNPQRAQNAELKTKWHMINAIVDHISLVKSLRGRAYYVTTGTWQNDKNLLATIHDINDDVLGEHIFSNDDFSFKPIDAGTLRNYYTDSTTKTSQRIYFPKRVVLPDVPNVTQGWSGFLSGTEFLKLIVDEDDDLRRSLFYDNVRDFQGDTGANKNIRETLESNQPENMAILNNGVTIIADNARLARDDVTLDNYQIVNGCQTSYVIYNNRDKVTSDVYVPVKIIVTTNSEVSTNITIGNNKQTAVKDDELLALTEVQKSLEQFFGTYDGKKRLYYERRSNQYNARTDVEKVRIVPLSISLRVYASMFLGIPHYASRYYGRLFHDYSSQVFNEKRSEIAFYTAAFALYRFNYYIRNSVFERKYSKFKYFILLMVRLYLTGDAGPEQSKGTTKRQCDLMNAVFWDDKSCQHVMATMVEVIRSVAGEKIKSNELTSKKYFLDEVLDKVRQLPPYDGSLPH